MTILLVDNDPTYLKLLSKVLLLHGYEVVSALNGEEAMSLLHVVAVDFVISDISMPKMNGMILHRSIRQDPWLKRLPFVWNSGYRELRDAVRIDDPTLDLKFEKAMPIKDLLLHLDRLATRKESNATNVKLTLVDRAHPWKQPDEHTCC